jgi:hypothetical protein
MNKRVNTYYKLSAPKRQWDMSEQYETQAEAQDDILKIQVRQKEKGFTPDNFIIIKVETETITDAGGYFVKSTVTETRV